MYVYMYIIYIYVYIYMYILYVYIYIWTQVGKAVVQFFRARDRNKDDAVDIVPADDPGLPNGAELLPVCVCGVCVWGGGA
jgi:hypothetical protein